MNFLKKFLQFIAMIVGALILAVLVTIMVDGQRTSYLKVGKNESANKNSYLITNVNIVPMTRDTILMDKMVLISDGVIKEIGDRIETEGLEILDAKNKYLMPGLIDMHVHVWDRYELGLYLSNGVTAIRNLWGMPMHLRIKEAVNNDEIISPLFFTTGPKLTGPEFIGDDNLNLTSPEEARDKVISYKERGYDFIKTYYGLTEDLYDAVIEQSIISDIDIVAHPSQKVPYSYHFDPQIKSIEHAEEIIQQPLNYQLDTTKLKEVIHDYVRFDHSALSPTLIVYNNIYQMLMDSMISDIDIVAHPSQKVPYSYHFDPQIKSIEHAEEIIQQPLNYQLDTTKLKEVVHDYVKSDHSALSPTLIVYNNIYQMLIDDDILSLERLDYMNPMIRKVDSKAQFDRWYNTKLKDSSIVQAIKNQHDFHINIIKKLHEANVTIICSTDAGIGVTMPGFSIHKELAFYKEAGLSNYEVLKTATINASKTHAIMNKLGSIQEGKVANLILVNENPFLELSTLQKPTNVFIRGRMINRETLDSFEEKAKNRSNLIPSAVRYLEHLIIER